MSKPLPDDPADCDDEPKNYEVGYGRPPKHSRFKKGISGNPGGRPRKMHLSDQEMLSQILDEIVTLPSGKRISGRELLMRRAVLLAHSGNSKLLRDLPKILANAPFAAISGEADLDSYRAKIRNALMRTAERIREEAERKADEETLAKKRNNGGNGTPPAPLPPA